MDEKKLEKILDKQTKELKDDYGRMGGFLLEQFEHKTQIIAESFTDLRESHHRLEQKVDAIMEMTAHNTETLEFVKSSLKRKVDIDEFESLEKRVLVLEKKVRVS